MEAIQVYVEAAKKQTFACAMDWPGWCRSGRDENSALQAVLDYGPRYARILHNTEIEFQPPADPSGLTVIERVEGNATTDFGAPAIILDADRDPLDQTEHERWRMLLPACWRAFDDAVERATGRELRKGPRGGVRWPARYFVRRVAWHILDHAWEIEDRVE